MKTLSRAWSLNEAWWHQVDEVMNLGRDVSPRGKLTKELPSKTLIFDMNYPVVTHQTRNLGYKFMAAEAWWILSGRDDVESIAPYAKHIVNFSDDGHKFFGAYGPPILQQLGYVVQALDKDHATRQAVLTTWRPNPPATKDVPCTVAFSWLIRDHALELHVFMRSSDNWLGIPYDAFNFSMLTAEIARQLNNCPNQYDAPLELGNCYLTAASSHIYETDFEKVRDALAVEPEEATKPVPKWLYGADEGYDAQGKMLFWTVPEWLNILKDTSKGDPRRWWE